MLVDIFDYFANFFNKDKIVCWVKGHDEKTYSDRFFRCTIITTICERCLEEKKYYRIDKDKWNS